MADSQRATLAESSQAGDFEDAESEEMSFHAMLLHQSAPVEDSADPGKKEKKASRSSDGKMRPPSAALTKRVMTKKKTQVRKQIKAPSSAAALALAAIREAEAAEADDAVLEPHESREIILQEMANHAKTSDEKADIDKYLLKELQKQPASSDPTKSTKIASDKKANAATSDPYLKCEPVSPTHEIEALGTVTLDDIMETRKKAEKKRQLARQAEGTREERKRRKTKIGSLPPPGLESEEHLPDEVIEELPVYAESVAATDNYAESVAATDNYAESVAHTEYAPSTLAPTEGYVGSTFTATTQTFTAAPSMAAATRATCDIAAMADVVIAQPVIEEEEDPLAALLDSQAEARAAADPSVVLAMPVADAEINLAPGEADDGDDDDAAEWYGDEGAAAAAAVVVKEDIDGVPVTKTPPVVKLEPVAVASDEENELEMEDVGDETDWYAEGGKAPKEDEEEEEVQEWDDACIVVRQGQLQVDMMSQHPRLTDEGLVRFCEWLNRRLAVVVSNFPYVRKNGASVDLSDNLIGPKGLDKLFGVLRDHRVPCVAIKVYRNLLDDTIVDTLVEYLHTQPESFPMHGIHMSHNRITEKGALRLIKAADSCGHYPRKLTRQPLWLRIELNHVRDPLNLVQNAQKNGLRLCLMQDGLCSDPLCDHLKNVAVQLPYFFNQSESIPDLPAVDADNNAANKTDDPSPKGKGGPGPGLNTSAQFGNNEHNPFPGKRGGGKGGFGKGGKGGNDGYSNFPRKGLGFGNKGKGYNNKGGGYNKGGKSGSYAGMGFSRPLPLLSLGQRKTKDIKITEQELGLEIDYPPGQLPVILMVDIEGEAGLQGALENTNILRINGIDATMLSQTQIQEVMAKRPLNLRLGKE